MHKTLTLIAQFTVLSFLLVGCHTTRRSSSPFESRPYTQLIKPIPDEDSMVVHLYLPKWNDEHFLFMTPKTVGTRRMAMVNFTDKNVRWTGPNEQWRTKSLFNTGTMVEYEISLLPTEDSVEAIYRLANRSGLKWESPWFFTLLAPAPESEFRTEDCSDRIFLESDGELVPASSFLEADSNKVTWLHETKGLEGEPHFMKQVGATSSSLATSNWMVGMNGEGNRWYALTAETPLFLFHNRDICSIHVAPDFGDLDPGQKVTISTFIYFGEGSLADAMEFLKGKADLNE